MAVNELYKFCIEKELCAVYAYCTSIQSSYCNIDSNVIKIIHNYCFPFMLTKWNAKQLSIYTNMNTKHAKYKYKKTEWRINDAYDVVILGEAKVGKTSMIMLRDTERKLSPTESISTYARCYRFEGISIDGMHTDSYLHDTGGDDNYNEMMVKYCKSRPSLCYERADVFMICMSVYDERRHSKHEILTDAQINTLAFCEEVQSVCPQRPCVLVGMKTDLRDNEKYKDKCYTKTEMEHFAYQCKCEQYTECNAVFNDNLFQSFIIVIQTAIRFRKQVHQQIHQPKNRKNCCVL